MKPLLSLHVLFYSTIGISLLSTSLLRGKTYTSFQPAIKNNLSCVVNIRTNSYQEKASHLDLYHRFNQGKPPLIPSQTSLGSGLIIEKSGYIVTTFQVISGVKEIFIKTSYSKKPQKAQIIGSDRKSNIALLKTSLSSSPCQINLADSDKVKIGDQLIAIGYPFGRNHLITQGILSSQGAVFGTGKFDRYFLTDTPIDPGNEGGALVDIRGRLVGIAMIRGEGDSPLNHMIPMNHLRKIIKTLKNSGKLIRPWLGIIAKDLMPVHQPGVPENNKELTGVIIGNMIVPSPAHRAGLNIGDLITKIDDTPLASVKELHQKMETYKPSDSIKLTIYRRVKGSFQLSLKLEEMPASSEIPDEDHLF